ncbi:MAG: universal stress protein, partial [Mesorhizobium sp.]
MAFKTILAVTGPSQGDGDLKLAAGLCEQFGAHLSVLVLVLAAPPSGGGYAAAVSPAWLEERRADLKRLKERTSVVSAFLSQIVTSGDLIDNYPDTAWADETIGRRARYADITVIGPELLAGATSAVSPSRCL